MTSLTISGIFILLVLFSLSFSIMPMIYAEGVTAKSIAFEETTIVEFTNDGPEDIKSFRIWTGNDFNFKSFKTEKGWSGEKTPQGVIVFRSLDVVKPGESIKIGVKTDKISTGFNWKALDKNEKQLGIGKTIAGEIPKPEIQPDTEKTGQNKGIFDDSVFRIIPEKPNVGSTIRVTGENFGVIENYDFYIDSKRIGSFVTNDAGYFITTMKIPTVTDADRVNFVVKDNEGNEKSISLRLGEIKSRIPETSNVKLSIQGISEIMHRGDFLEISGTGNPGSGISISVYSPSGVLINTRTVNVDSKGIWELSEPIIIPTDVPFGEYSVEISDGKDKITEKWDLASDKVIIIVPEKLKFEPGSVMKFNGTALPNIPIELVLEDPLGSERFSDILEVDDSGIVSFEYHTTENIDKEGTWTLIATQEKNKELIYAGLGTIPSIPINLVFDKLNYKSSDKAIITLSGKPSEVLNLLIIDPSDKPKGDSISITLKPDGTGTYQLDLKGYSAGIYNAVISKGGSKNTETFTVGLQTGSGKIVINTTKLKYNPGEAILILGETNPNILLTITLYDPNGNEIKSKQTFSDKNGKISEDGFRIPSNAIPGKWQLKATSGSNFDIQDIEITAVKKEGMVVSVIEGDEIAGIGKSITIKVLGAIGTVKIEIIDGDDEVIEKLEFPSSTQGEINLPWIIKKDTIPGVYTIAVSDALNSAETTYEIK